MLSLVLLALVAAPPAGVSRTTTISVYTKKLAAVTDLGVDEVAVAENGKTCKVTSVELDRRPLEVAIVVDSGGTVAPAYRSDLVPAVVSFWQALPAGTKFAVWSTAPAQVMDFEGDPAAAESKLRMIAAAGGNYGFDSMIDACRALGRRGAPRRAVVYVGSGSLQGSVTGTSTLTRAVGEARATPMTVLVLPSARGAFGGGPSGDAVQSWDVQGYFGSLSKSYRGAYVEALSTLAIAQWLRQFAADINGQYRVRYDSEGGPFEATKVEVRRKDTKMRLGWTTDVIASP